MYRGQARGDLKRLPSDGGFKYLCKAGNPQGGARETIKKEEVGGGNACSRKCDESVVEGRGGRVWPSKTLGVGSL